MVESIVEFVEPQFGEWGYHIVFLARLLENSAFIGAVIPGDIVLLLAGFYAERGTLELGPIVALAFAGALIGDNLGYLIGRLFGRRIIDRWGDRVWLPHDRIERFEVYFREYGMWAVAIGRITPFVRTFNTFAAGMTRMPFWQFFISAGLAAAAWSVAVPVLGFVFSGSYEIARTGLGWFGVAAFVLFIGLLYWTYRRTLRHIAERRAVDA